MIPNHSDFRLVLENAPTLDHSNGPPLPHGGLVIPMVDDEEFEARLSARRKEQTRLAAAKLTAL